MDGRDLLAAEPRTLEKARPCLIPVAEAGDLAVNEPGTEHSFEVLPGPELFYLVVVAGGGVQIGDEHFSPEDPRL